MSHGAGSKVYDVDGTEYVDMHGSYGASIAGQPTRRSSRP
jgi:glutamate-1-semialdehyde 2,1-aminomutase